jgi:NitT/TauT family transport system permease protein
LPCWSCCSLGWEAAGAHAAGIPHYVLPAPSLVLATLWANLGSLMLSWWFTVKITFGARWPCRRSAGVGLAGLFALSPWVERSFLPWRSCCRSPRSSPSRR